jgi:RNA polymerase sigma factor (sigma-70 family)
MDENGNHSKDPKLSEAIQVALYNSYFSDDKEYFFKYFKNFIMGTATKIAVRWNKLYELNDLKQDAYIHILNLMEKYDPMIGVNIEPFIYSQLPMIIFNALQVRYKRTKMMDKFIENEIIHNNTSTKDIYDFGELETLINNISEKGSKNFAKVLKLTAQGLRQKEIADIIGITQPCINQFYHGLRSKVERSKLRESRVAVEAIRDYLLEYDGNNVRHIIKKRRGET